MIRPDELFGIDTLKDLDEAQRGLVSEMLEERVVMDGKPVFEEGDPGDSAYFILEGSVRVLRQGDEDGEDERTLAEIRNGWIVGEMALLDKGPRSASAISRGRCRFARLPREAFEQMLTDHPAAASLILRRLARMLSMRLRRTNSLVT